MQALQERMKQLEDAFNTNTKVFSDGIQMLEAQQEVLRRVVQDLYLDPDLVKAVHYDNGGVKISTIDWNAYLKDYIAELAAAEEKAEQEKTHVKEQLIVPPGEDTPIIFGGSP